MSVAALPKAVPYYMEASGYWTDLTTHFQEQLKAINETVNGRQEGIAYQSENWKFSMSRAALPSTEIHVALAFEAWGPQVRCQVRGEQAENLHFYPEDCEFGVSSDQYDEVIAVTSEGKSLSPHDLAKYVLQHFRRSYPGITLPCPETTLP